MPPASHSSDDRTIDKPAIRVEAVMAQYFSPDLRIHYGKTYSIEHDAEVKDLGMVVEAQVDLFLENYRSCHGGS